MARWARHGKARTSAIAGRLTGAGQQARIAGHDGQFAEPPRRPRATAAPLQRVLDLVLPPRCLGCGELVERQGTLCVTCWAAIAFVTDPQCRCCGLPFAFDPGSDADAPRGEAAGAGSL